MNLELQVFLTFGEIGKEYLGRFDLIIQLTNFPSCFCQSLFRLLQIFLVALELIFYILCFSSKLVKVLQVFDLLPGERVSTAEPGLHLTRANLASDHRLTELLHHLGVPNFAKAVVHIAGRRSLLRHTHLLRV